MDELIDQQELNKAVSRCFSNSGKLEYNNTIRKLCSIFNSRYGISNQQLIKEFKGWFYERQLDKKWSPELCSLHTFILSTARIFLLKLLKEKDDYYKNTYSVIETKYPFVSNASSACYKREGKWTQIPFLSYENQEDEYLLAELEHYIDGYNIIKNHNEIFLSFFRGEIKIREAAELLGVSRITIMRAKTNYICGLFEYLEKLGYTYYDLLEIYKK